MRFLTKILILLVLIVAAPALAEISTSPHLYLLVDTPEGPVIERVSLAMGEETLIDDERVISFILPLGSGQSGDLVKAADPKARLLVSSSEQGITVSVKRPDGTTRSYPEISYADLAAVDIRLNIISGSGDKLAYMLRGYESVESDSGPVIDMFRGMIPMAPGDYTVTSEVIPRAPVVQVAGAAELRLIDDDPVVSVELPGGKQGDFIMDIGAGATAIGRKWLPAGTEITKLIGMEYSSSGTREVPGTMGGAGGDVGGFLGVAQIPFLKIGDIVFEDVRVSVVEEMPAFGGHPFAGILGLDLLSRA
ncbi:MAG: hypothetical protein GY946_07620, partial [bacterium]|nr:hypothetical protein [bacterium]